MMWITTNSKGEKIVFEKKGSVLKSMTVNVEGFNNTASYDTLIERAKKWFSTNSKYCLHKKKEN